MYSRHNEEKYVVAERFIRNLKTKIYKYMTSIAKNVCIDRLDDIVNKYNNTYHRAMKIILLMLKIIRILIQIKKSKNRDPKLQVGDIVRISKHKNIFAKGYTPNWSEKVFKIKKVKNTVQWRYVNLVKKQIMTQKY